MTKVITENSKILAEQVLKQAQDAGATSAEVAIDSQQGVSVSVRQRELETIEYTNDQGLGITVYCGTKKGNAATSDLSPDAIKSTVQAAVRIAKQGSDDPCHGLADRDRMATAFPDLELNHPWDIEVSEAKDIALECENYALNFDDRIINSDGANVSTHQGYHVLANTHGFVGERRSTLHSINCMVIGQQTDEMQRDYHYTTGRDPLKLENVKSVGTQAAERTIARLGARQIKTQTTPVIFHAEVARGLIGHFVAAIRGTKLYRKSSFLLDQLGKQIFPTWMNMEEQPYLKGGIASAVFDNEGVATAPRHLVKEGLLQGYVLSSYGARRLGMSTTANAGGVHNLIVEPGQKDFNVLLKQMDRGLLVTELMGHGINITTGDYSRGACGFWVENGEIQYPVHEITIAGQLKDMFQHIVAIANDNDPRGSIQSGSILLESMKVAGN